MTGLNMSGVAASTGGGNGDTQALHVMTTTGADHVYAQVNAVADDLWVGCHVKWLADLPASGNFSGYVVGIDDVDGITDADAWLIAEDSGSVNFLTAWSSGVFAAVVLNTWYKVDLRFVKGSPRATELWIDDVDQSVTVAGNQTQDSSSVSFGILWPGGWETAYELYLANLKIGTTRGGAETWSTTLTDLSDFDLTVANGQTLEVISVAGP